MSKKSLTLTIVIPVYNEQRYLKPCLKAIYKQSMPADEVIVVDNASTDETLKTVAKFPLVKLLHESRRGIAYARNTGFNATKSHLIARIDADTILPQDWVAKVKDTYMSAGSPQAYTATGPGIFRNQFPGIWFGLHRLTYFWFGKLLIGDWPLYGANMALSRHLWDTVKDEVCLRDNMDLHEDMDLAWHIRRNKVRINFIKGMTCSVLGRRMSVKSFYYPIMMIRIRLVRHDSVPAQETQVNQEAESYPK